MPRKITTIYELAYDSSAQRSLREYNKKKKKKRNSYDTEVGDTNQEEEKTDKNKPKPRQKKTKDKTEEEKEGKTEDKTEDKTTKTRQKKTKGKTEEEKEGKKEEKKEEKKEGKIKTYEEWKLAGEKKDKALTKERVYWILGLIAGILVSGLLTWLYMDKQGCPAYCTKLCEASATSAREAPGGCSGGNEDPGGGSGGNEVAVVTTGQPVVTSELTVTGVTRTYPLMTQIQRVPSADLSSTSFEIGKSVLLLTIPATISGTWDSEVTHELNIVGDTQTIVLHCAVEKISSIYMKDATDNILGEVKDITFDTGKQLLTLKLPQKISGTTVKLQIAYRPSNEAFEKASFACGPTNCAVFLLQRLSSLVPHFGYHTKHPWIVNVTHPSGLKVVSNHKTGYEKKTSTFTPFQETFPLLPSQFSLLLVENMVYKVEDSKNPVELFYPNDTAVGEVDAFLNHLTEFFQNQSIHTPSITANEKLFVVLVPVIEDYVFYGPNIALVGPEIWKSKTEERNVFMWRWLFRVIIYSKVTASHRNDVSVYEQSALFLAMTNTESIHKDTWKKHIYELALDSGPSSMVLSANRTVDYEDERRYFGKAGHAAKVMTLLVMLVSHGSKATGDLLKNLDGPVTDSSTTFFFLKPEIDLGNGQKLNVDTTSSCYLDSPELPHVHIGRVNTSHLAIQRSGLRTSCDMDLWIVKYGSKERKHLSVGAEEMVVDATSHIVLSGDSPFSAYSYSMDQSELEIPNDGRYVTSTDWPSLKMLLRNALRTAFEGKISYGSLKTFIDFLLTSKIISVDEAIDLWMWTLRQSRNDNLRSLTIPIIKSVTKEKRDKVIIIDIFEKLEKSVKESNHIETEKIKGMIKFCGDPCMEIPRELNEGADCLTKENKNCSYDRHLLEMSVCSKVVLYTDAFYNTFANLYDKCTAKPCLLPTLRGLLCTTDTSKLQEWLTVAMAVDISDIAKRQVVLTIFKGLASNYGFKTTLFNHFVENWHLIHKKYYKNPPLLGEIVDILGSTICTREQLKQFKQFEEFHGDGLKMFKEFKDQAIKAEKAIKWNEDYSKDFSGLFN